MSFFFFDLAAWLWGRTGRPSVSDLLRLIRVPGGLDPAGQSVCGGLREPTPYQLHHGVAWWQQQNEQTNSWQAIGRLLSQIFQSKVLTRELQNIAETGFSDEAGDSRSISLGVFPLLLLKSEDLPSRSSPWYSRSWKGFWRCFQTKRCVHRFSLECPVGLELYSFQQLVPIYA